ncbi:MAG: DUF2244 domain-containing protein [Rhodospirillales bacterium]|nr:DUF2244 domain-containing protein [Rhodospirillales bacterium]
MSDIQKTFDKAVYFERELRPHRSLGGPGRKAFYGTAIGFGILTNLFAVKAGMTPLAIPIDLTLAGLAYAMNRSNRSGGEYQKLTLTDDGLEIRHYVPGTRGETVKTLSPYLLQVRTTNCRQGICEKVSLESKGKKTEIGRFLPPEEKAQVAQDLKAALHKMHQPTHI